MGAGQSSQREALLPSERTADAESAIENGTLISPSSTAAKVSVRGLSWVIDGDTILNSVSLEAESGKITTLIGPSGSGKSTILRCLIRLWEPERGCVFLDGVDITAVPVTTLRRRVGMLFQTPPLFDGTVAYNVRYGPSLAGKTLSDAEVDKYLVLANLDSSFASQAVTSLSGGQAQRVALARALANEPEVLLLDEPTSALDPAATLSVEESIRKLKETTGITVIWVSHSVEQVQRVADKVVLLVDGQVRDEFAPADLENGSHELAKQFAEGKLKGRRNFVGESAAPAGGS